MRLGPPSPNRSDDLAPVQINMRAMFLIGTAIWVVSGAVVGSALANGVLEDTLWLAVCGAGAGIGVGGWLWARWRRR